MDHLAFMASPWFKFIQDNSKPIESRCSINKKEPYEKIKKGDRIWWKENGDFAVYCYSLVKNVKFWHGCITVQHKLREFQDQIKINEEYIRSKNECYYLTLMWLEPTIFPKEGEIPISYPFRQKKGNRRSWICDYDPTRSDW